MLVVAFDSVVAWTSVVQASVETLASAVNPSVVLASDVTFSPVGISSSIL